MQPDPILGEALQKAMKEQNVSELSKIAGIVFDRWNEAVAAYEYMKKNFYRCEFETHNRADLDRLIEVLNLALLFTNKK